MVLKIIQTLFKIKNLYMLICNENNFFLYLNSPLSDNFNKSKIVGIQSLVMEKLVVNDQHRTNSLYINQSLSINSSAASGQIFMILGLLELSNREQSKSFFLFFIIFIKIYKFF